MELWKRRMGIAIWFGLGGSFHVCSDRPALHDQCFKQVWRFAHSLVDMAVFPVRFCRFRSIAIHVFLARKWNCSSVGSSATMGARTNERTKIASKQPVDDFE